MFTLDFKGQLTPTINWFHIHYTILEHYLRLAGKQNANPPNNYIGAFAAAINNFTTSINSSVAPFATAWP